MKFYLFLGGFFFSFFLKAYMKTMADRENKLRGQKHYSVWFPKNTKERKNTEENGFLMFNCLIKKLGCIWFSENTKERK